MNELKATGPAKDAGFQTGVEKTFPISMDNAWDYLFSKEGLDLWLGEISAGDLHLKNFYHTKEGGEGQVKTLKTLSHIRLTWKKKAWKNSSTVQVRLTKVKNKTTISFQQETLLNTEQKEEMQKYWNNVIDKMSEKLIKA